MTNLLNSLKILNCDTLDIQADKTFWRQDRWWIDSIKETAYKNYRELAKQYHPDKSGGSIEKMTELNLAFETVKKEFEKGEENIDLKYLTISEKMERAKAKKEEIRKNFNYLKSLNINPHRRVLNAFTLDLKYAASFDTIYEASLRTGIPQKTIESAIKNYKSNIGYYFLWSNYKKPKKEKPVRVPKFRINKEFGQCIVCKNKTMFKNGKGGLFCSTHNRQYYNKIIDINGKPLKEKVVKPKLPCKLCDSQSRSNGFCYMHYRRYRRKQIDINGVELKPLCRAKTYEYNGKNLTASEWAKELNLTSDQVYKRLLRHPIHIALSVPRYKVNKAY